MLEYEAACCVYVCVSGWFWVDVQVSVCVCVLLSQPLTLSAGLTSAIPQLRAVEGVEYTFRFIAETVEEAKRIRAEAIQLIVQISNQAQTRNEEDERIRNAVAEGQPDIQAERERER